MMYPQVECYLWTFILLRAPLSGMVGPPFSFEHRIASIYCWTPPPISPSGRRGTVSVGLLCVRGDVREEQEELRPVPEYLWSQHPSVTSPSQPATEGKQHTNPANMHYAAVNQVESSYVMWRSCFQWAELWPWHPMSMQGSYPTSYPT